MKKLLLGLFVAVFASVGISAGASATGTIPQTSVTGVVTKDHVAVANADVTVLCNGHTLMDTTDAQGSYLVNFPSADCPFGHTVKVTATKGEYSGVKTGTVTGVTTKLNLAIVNVEIPEYGVIGAFAAGGMGLGLIAYTRRQQKNATTA